LFNVYLEEAIKSSQKLEEVRSRGDLLAFADDMLVMSNQRGELELIIDELTKLQHQWNMRLNKRKSEILTGESEEEINGIKCASTVKYLGVRVAVDKKEQIKISKEQVNKNVQLLKWKLKSVDSDVL
jgi:Reverse transcriptase (RNA-dependent DNA polymerase)